MNCEAKILLSPDHPSIDYVAQQLSILSHSFDDNIILTSMLLAGGSAVIEGKTYEGISSPLNPAFTDDDPTSTTIIFSSAILIKAFEKKVKRLFRQISLSLFSLSNDHRQRRILQTKGHRLSK